MEDRRLAAIMFTDIVGYTALMGSDEKKAFEVLRKNRNIQKPIIKKYRGKWLKEMGDGILASFDTASDAVRCAGEIQIQAKKENIELRIGIHTGEVVFEGNDVLGDGVNVASRLEELAEKGCIYISGSVYKDIKNKEGIKAEFVEEKVLKNVDEPVRIYRVECEDIAIEPLLKEKQKATSKKVLYYFLAGVLVIIVGGLIWYRLLIRPDGEIEKSIAVLPFKNIGGSNDNQILCDGMLEEILNKLEHISDLNVLSRTSVEKYQNTPVDIKEIGKELEAGNILEGSVRMQGEKFRITAQLIQAGTGYHLWSGNFDGTLSDTIFIVQSKIAEEIANNLNAILTPSERQQINKIPTFNYEAFEIYTRGLNLLHNFWKMEDSTSLYEAETLFRDAIKIDTNFLLPYHGLALVYQEKGILDSINVYAEKMIMIDPNSAAGYNFRGIYFWSQGMLDKSIESYNKSININPNRPWPYSQLGRIYCLVKRDYLKGIPYVKKAEELLTKQKIPDETFNAFAGQIYMSLGKNKRAKQYFEKSLEINAMCWVSREYCDLTGYDVGWEIALRMADSLICNISTCEYYCNVVKRWAYYFLNEYEQALLYYDICEEKGYYLGIGDRVTLAFIYEKLGKEQEALEVINACRESINNEMIKFPDMPGYYKAWLNTNLCSISLMLNEKEEAIQYLTKAAQLDITSIEDLDIQPEYEKLYDNPDFKTLVKQAKDEKAALRAQIEEIEERGELNL